LRPLPEVDNKLRMSQLVYMIATKFQLLYPCVWGQNSIPSSLSVLLDPGNMSVAVGISLLSCIRAEIYVMSYLLPVNGRHL